MTVSKKKTSRNKVSSGGFSLIELSIALVIMGLFLVPILQGYNLYMEREKIIQSKERISVIQSALQRFALSNGRYPAPANKNRTIASADFGVEDHPGAPPLCTAASVTVCRTTGFRDVVLPAGNDPVLVGDVPFATLGLPIRYTNDSYSRRFTYAVSEYLTSSATFRDDGGVIKVLNLAGGNTTGTSNNAHYVIINHGEDGRGAVSEGGTLTSACAGLGRDIENCDNDATYTDNYTTFGVAPNSYEDRYSVFNPGANYYDDYIGWRTTTAGDTWTIVANSPDIYNRNSGNIRISNWGTSASPKSKIDVAGTAANPGNVTADTLQTNRICTYDEETAAGSPDVGCWTGSSTAALVAPGIYAGKVFTPSVIGGSANSANEGKTGGGILCKSGYALSDIKYVDEVCNSRSIPAGTLGVSVGCSGGGVGGRQIVGGTLTCSTP